MRADGTGLRRLTRGKYDGGPAWAPNGRRIAFFRETLAATKEIDDIFVVNIDGSGLRRLVPNALSVAWAPDGREIAFVRLEMNKASGQSVDNVYVRGAGGGAERRIATLATGGDRLAWSPDGKRIAYSASELDAQGVAGPIFLAVMNADGTGAEKLIGNGYSPEWSPDGRRIAFVRAAIGHDTSDTWVIGAAGGAARRVTRDGEHPSWSPDGKRIVVGGIRRLSGGVGPGVQYDSLYVVNVDGTKRKLLDPFGLEAHINSSQPAWHG